MDTMLTAGNLAPADVLLYRSDSWIGRAIRFFDDPDVNHAGLYLGDDCVGEALADGLQRRPLATSVAGELRVSAFRLRHTPATMAPVLTRANEYLNQGQRYAYEQLLLLALLALTRKPKVTPVLRALIRKVLDGAASLMKMTAMGQEPMICSEFVYRCYDEALPPLVDEYTIEVNPLRMSAQPPTSRVGAAPPAPRGRGVHPESLLALIGSRAPRAWRPAVPIRPTAAARGVPAAPDRAGIDALIERYLAEATAPPRAAAGAAPMPSLSDEEMQEAVLRFAEALAASRPVQPRLAGAGLAAAASPLDLLFRTAADFVTPGDLLHSESLMKAGDLDLTAIAAAVRPPALAQPTAKAPAKRTAKGTAKRTAKARARSRGSARPARARRR